MKFLAAAKLSLRRCSFSFFKIRIAQAVGALSSARQFIISSAKHSYCRGTFPAMTDTSSLMSPDAPGDDFERASQALSSKTRCPLSAFPPFSLSFSLFILPLPLPLSSSAFFLPFPLPSFPLFFKMDLSFSVSINMTSFSISLPHSVSLTPFRLAHSCGRIAIVEFSTHTLPRRTFWHIFNLIAQKKPLLRSSWIGLMPA